MWTPERQAEGLAFVCARDGVLRGLLDRLGAPPLWARSPGFAALALIMLEQQVSLASARAAFWRLEGAVGEVKPPALLAAGEATLRGAGLTRQKTAYLLALSKAVETGTVDLDRLAEQDDDAARASLTAIKGIGHWTADIYLLLALGRPDVLPVGDLALVLSAKQVYGLESRPTPAQLIELAETWRPWRSAAARLLWHAYLSERGRVFAG